MAEGGEVEGKMKYLIRDKGLFAIIRHAEHNLCSGDEDFQYKKLNYEADEKSLIKLVHPNGERQGIKKLLDYLNPKKTTKPPNLKLGLNLTTGNGKGSFNAFVRDKIQGYAMKHAPSFVMVCLLTHGFENGLFLLSECGTNDAGVNTTSKELCCDAAKPGDRHTGEADCYVRHIVKDLIKKVEETYRNVPKIFLIQCCRGGERGVVKKGEADPKVHFKSVEDATELFVSGVQDSLVLRACVERHTCWVLHKGDLEGAMQAGGSILVQSFCQAVEELMETQEKFQKVIEGLKDDERANQSSIDWLQRSREDVTGGWIMNVCHRTIAIATNYLWISVSLPHNKLGRLLKKGGTEIRWMLAPERQEVTNEKFIKSLKSWQKQEQSDIQGLIDLCKDDRKGEQHGMAMLSYLWTNVRERTIKTPLLMSKRETARVEPILREIIRKLREEATKRPYDKQQPHISSSLSKKLSVLDLIQSQRR